MKFTRFYILIVYFFCISSLWATHPVRSITIQLPDGSLLEIPYTSPDEDKRTHRCQSIVFPKRVRSLDASTADGLGKKGLRSKGIVNSLGSPNIPVVLAEFTDIKFKKENTLLKFDSLFNHKGYASNILSRGSVRDFFVDQSYGQFLPNFSILGKFETKQKRSYYGANSGGNKNLRVGELYKEMAEALVASGADLSPFIEEGNRIPLLIIIFAGAGEHNSHETGSEDYIWAHFRESYNKIGSTIFLSYFVGSEVSNIYRYQKGKIVYDSHGRPLVENTRLEGIGVLCHEFGHSLGLTDAYNTNTGAEKNETPDFHDLMDYGQYCANGYRPMGFSAYQRSLLGWIELQELKQNQQNVQLAPLNQTPELPIPQAYIIRNPQNTKEYFILENRQESNWFSPLLGKGMLVYHVIYDQEAWKSNTPNNQKNILRYTILPADGKWQNHITSINDGRRDFTLYQGDFFPGFNNVDYLDSISHTKFKWYNGNKVGKLSDIILTEKNLIKFNYNPSVTSISSVLTESPPPPLRLHSVDGRVITPNTIIPGFYIIDKKKVFIQ